MSFIVFGYDTALNLFRFTGDRLASMPRAELDLSEACGSLNMLAGTQWEKWLARYEGPVHLVVGSDAKHRSGTRVSAHVWGGQDAMWPTIELGPGVYVSAPEFVFLQMARTLSRERLVFLGCELCGIYCWQGDDLAKRTQICSQARMVTFLERRVGANGVAKARNAAMYVLDCSRSPMETELALRLCLPSRFGGYGIACTELNKEIPLKGQLAYQFGRDHITPDLLWEGPKLAIEYDSDEGHTGADRITTDSRRRFILEKLGYRVITVTNAQMKSTDEFRGIAEEVTHLTGKRVGKLSYAQLAKKRALARELHICATNKMLLTLAGK